MAIGGHHCPDGGHDEWLTPPCIIQACGPFDLDPCAPVSRPWDTAIEHYSIVENGLSQPWLGRVWCNPPYGKDTGKWLSRMAQHGNGIALIFARTETRMFFEHVWPHASAMLFIEGRLHFHFVSGVRAPTNAGAPSVLVAYGDECAERLHNSGIAGKFVHL